MIKAIETMYNNRRFRSRIEARWAIVLDTLRVRYEYEKEGYELPSGWYLPDFWLPRLGCWLEIKGMPPTAKESTLAHELANGTNANVYLFYGDISTGKFGDSDYGEVFFPEDGWDNNQMLCECLSCGAIGIEFDGRSNRLKCKQDKCPRSAQGDKGYSGDSDRILWAYAKATSARFEHGDGVANACIAEGAERIEELRDENKEIRKIVGELGRTSIDLQKRLDEIAKLAGHQAQRWLKENGYD